MAYRLNTGYVTIPVKDEDDNELFSVRFNPADIGILKRLDNVIAFFDTIKVGGDKDVIQLDNEIRAQFDYLLGDKVSEKMFSVAAPLSPMQENENGTAFFFEDVLHCVGAIINDEMERRTNKRIDKEVEKVLNGGSVFPAATE